MEKPDLTRVVETFVRIPVQTDWTSLQWWQSYVQMLRSTVAPLLRHLMEDGTIIWYSFLVHNRASGVPTHEGDDAPYIHLRLGAAASTDRRLLVGRLPAVCEMTRDMSIPEPPSLDTVDIGSLAGGRVEEGWRVLGESSEWALRLLAAHAPSLPVPAQNVAQFLHYLGNQLQAGAVRIPMP